VASWSWVIGMIAVPACVAAQDVGWHSTVDASATTLFGATSQTLASFATSVSRDGEDFSADATAKFYYGESKDADRITFVSARSWALGATFDALPKARVSPFLLGSAEASLEKRIASRTSGGVGAKWVFTRTNTGSASISLALLGERLTPLADTAVESSKLARWSWRVKTKQQVGERVGFTHVTFYAPQVNAFDRYTITSTSMGSYSMTKAVALTLTFIDNFDSQARSRGALANNDGSLLFGVRGKF